MKPKVALVHDYISEFGGAERVLEALSELYPDAPIYTAFYQEGSAAHQRFKDKVIHQSFAAKIPGFISRLHSPLRFMAPMIWESFDFSDYDIVISSASWYITKGILTRPETMHICYCHTPPRYLYGYPTSIEWQKYFLVRQYARIVNKFLKRYDYLAAKRVDYFVVNSKEVQERVNRFYEADSQIIYPPVEVDAFSKLVTSKKDNYLLTGGRLVGAKHFDVIVVAANSLNLSLKVYGDGPLKNQLQSKAGQQTEFLGKVSDKALAKLYANAQAFICLATDEDFGITPVEAMAAGTPVLAYKGGGYLETVIDGKTGIFIEELSVEAVMSGIKKIQETDFKKQDLVEQAEKFSKERFMKEMVEFVDQKWQEYQQDYDL